MIKLISHRGNLYGKIIENENNPNYIYYALNSGFDVEIDVWYDNGFWLGHDSPTHKTDTKFLINHKLWCHAKNLNALYELGKINTRFFWHENDSYTITSDKIIWAYPGQPLNSMCICVLPELHHINHNLLDCYGICSDYIGYWRI